MTRKNTVVGTLFGITLDASVEELWLGPARIFWNPAVPSQLRASDPWSNADIWQDSPQGRVRIPVAKLLIDLEFGGENAETQGHAIKEDIERLERAVLPLRLCTGGRVLVKLVKLGGGAREQISSEGIMAEAPYLSGILCHIANIDKAACALLQEFSQSIHAVPLDQFKIPIDLFSSSYYRTREIDRGIDLLVALEALLSESPESISMKISLRAACLLETEGRERKRIYETVKNAYNHRNTLVHGRRKRPTAEEWFQKNTYNLEDIVRGALRCVIGLARKGIILVPENCQ